MTTHTKKQLDVSIDTSIIIRFNVSPREYSLIVKGLKLVGGNGEKLAWELEKMRIENWKEIVRRFNMFIETKEEQLENAGQTKKNIKKD